MEHGLDPVAFWDQSPASFAAAMRGRIAARANAYDLALFGAWQGERFARTDKLQPLAHYLKRKGRRTDRPAIGTPQTMLAAFATLAGTGAPITIEKLR